MSACNECITRGRWRIIRSFIVDLRRLECRGRVSGVFPVILSLYNGRSEYSHQYAFSIRRSREKKMVSSSLKNKFISKKSFQFLESSTRIASFYRIFYFSIRVFDNLQKKIGKNYLENYDISFEFSVFTIYLEFLNF